MPPKGRYRTGVKRKQIEQQLITKSGSRPELKGQQTRQASASPSTPPRLTLPSRDSDTALKTLGNLTLSSGSNTPTSRGSSIIDNVFTGTPLDSGTSSSTWATPDPSARTSPAPHPKDLSNPNMSLLRTLRRVYAATTPQDNLSLMSLDVEMFERNHSRLLEFGWTVMRNRTREPVHVIVSENARFRNGRWCPDNRDNYTFGASQTMRQSHLRTVLNTVIDTLSCDGPLLLIFHAANMDITALDRLGVDTSHFTRMHKNKAFEEDTAIDKLKPGVYIVDTQFLYQGLSYHGELLKSARDPTYLPQKRTESLQTCCQKFTIPTKALHNAGNDAYYTLSLFERLMNCPIPA